MPMTIGEELEKENKRLMNTISKKLAKEGYKNGKTK